MSPLARISHRIRVAAACTALAWTSAVLAEPAAPPQAPMAPASAAGSAAPGMTHERLRAIMQERHAEHVTALLDHLAGRLEIKASQEPSWQAFAAALRELMTPPPHVDGAAGGAAQDAAALAREHAEHAAAHAQKLARLADATAKLEQALSTDQREVLDEAARRLAHRVGDHPWMAHGDGYGGHEGAHCDAHHGHDGMHPGHPGHDDDDDEDESPHHPMPH